MKLRVLVVDDSRFYRNRVVEMLSADPGLEVVDTAENGREAVQKVREKRPDVITMDVEMPVMDGISAVREIMKTQPTPIMMFSSLTVEGAKATFDALEAGALDYMPKRFEDMVGDKSEVAAEFCERLKHLGKKRLSLFGHTHASTAAKTPARPAQGKGIKDLKSYRLVIIGASTGGPAALQAILTELNANFPLPVIIVQHMPGAFTGPFAQRLNGLCRVRVKEAEHGDIAAPGTVLIAPGGKQLEFERGILRLKVRDAAPNEQYKPSVNVTFGSAAEMVGGGILAIVLTGMGSDGKLGAIELKKHGASVWAQDEASCVVYGMPHAIVDGGLADRVLSLSEIGVTLGSVDRS